MADDSSDHAIDMGFGFAAGSSRFAGTLGVFAVAISSLFVLIAVAVIASAPAPPASR